MANEKRKKEQSTDDLLRDLLIVQLGLAGLTQHEIREIVGVDINRVNRIVKHFKKLNR
jgi:transposase-like protein